MRKTMLKALCLITAALMLAAVIPFAALAKTAVRYPTPEGYDDHDYQQAVAFLETTDEDGMSNAEKLRALFPYEFDLADPSTWGGYVDPYGSYYIGFEWTDDPVKRLRRIDIQFEGAEDITCPVGDVDLSDCTALESVTLMSVDLGFVDFSGCSAITGIWCDDAQDICLTGCTELTFLSCDASGTPEIDISDCSKLERIQLSGSMTRLDVSNCPHLNFLSIGSTSIRTLDVTMCPEITTLLCSWCELEELDAAGLAALEHLELRQTPLKRLDINGCTALNVLYCSGTMLTELDISTCPELYFDHIRAEGGGYIGSDGGGMYGWMNAVARPRAGSEFLGWYSENGELISTELSLSLIHI